MEEPCEIENNRVDNNKEENVCANCSEHFSKLRTDMTCMYLTINYMHLIMMDLLQKQLDRDDQQQQQLSQLVQKADSRQKQQQLIVNGQNLQQQLQNIIQKRDLAPALNLLGAAQNPIPPTPDASDDELEH